MEFSSVQFDGKDITLLDQTKLPTEEIYITINKLTDLWQAIFELKVRGAPAIGIAAAYGIALRARQLESELTDNTEFIAELCAACDYLATSRPTAVNLFWALDRIRAILNNADNKTIQQISRAVVNEARLIELQDAETCRKIGQYALTLFKDGMTILTHCNAGAIATAKYGTALAPVYLAKEQGMDIKVFADETRPLLQGARLTAWELQKAGIDVTLITDNMAAYVMKLGKVNAVIVGCDRVAANGDTANKIGTYGVAILAQKHNIPFYVACPVSTIDIQTKTGDDIPIEERPAAEIRCFAGKQSAPADVKVFNPAFDVTPHELINAIITEDGILYPPYETSIAKLFNK